MSLPAGWYQISISAVLASGEESGAPPATMVQVSEGQVIELTLPSAPGIDHFSIYCSDTDGDTLYWALDVANGISNAIIDGGRGWGNVLETQHLQPLPQGQLIRSYRGRVYVAAENVLAWSEPLRYGLYDPRNNWLELPAEITLLAPAEDGLYVGTRAQTLWLSGDDPKDHRLVTVDRRGVIPGSAVQAPPEVFPSDQEIARTGDQFPCWMDTDGVQVVGYPGGRIRRITASAHVDTDYRTAAAAYLEQRGINQLLTILKTSTSGTSSARASDRVTSRIIPPGE